MAIPNTVVVGQVARDLVLVVPHMPDIGSRTEVSERRELLGGKGANIAVAAAQLGNAVTLIGAIGSDETAGWLVAQAELSGVETAYVRRQPDTVSALIVDVVTPDGSWRYFEDIPDEVLDTPADIGAAKSAFANAHSVIVQLQQPTETAVAAVQQARGARIVLDGVPRAEQLLASADVLRMDQQEGEQLTGAKLDTVDNALTVGQGLLRRGPDLVVLATAEANVFLWNDGQAVFPLGDTTVKDTTGAGDALVAALTVGLDSGLGPYDAARMSVAAAARTVDHAGGRPDLDPDEVWP
ncbi:hypothetical protein ALI144C_24990 [Actinosynnema sp. ALI-1.44]|uniref:PfkB family carbohydrate kinase n=1 Tax=Actinosynnema sp. ALI-1.44 TaxID=1933779 RepID=UPI00097CA399|nr:PfkB family carbohydrate kinase [Actinosynnema sp. ALI-1.44]ONI79973.1 hypothetical protein ALI144C_24990 [Actinosynnema sp. ALI-1.44]